MAAMATRFEEKMGEYPGAWQYRKFFKSMSKIVVCVRLHVKLAGNKGTCLHRGTGVVINERGAVLTCWHLLQDVEDVTNVKKATVTFRNGELHNAHIVRYDKSMDVMLLTLESTDKKFDFGFLHVDSKMGQPVIAMGLPRLAVFFGRISSSRRLVSECGGAHPYISGDVKVIEVHGLYVPHGVSGGPLFDFRGRVLGLVSFEQANLNCAISATFLNRFLRDYDAGLPSKKSERPSKKRSHEPDASPRSKKMKCSWLRHMDELLSWPDTSPSKKKCSWKTKLRHMDGLLSYEDVGIADSAVQM